MPFLEVFRGTQSSIIELTKKSFTIGRHEDCDLVLMAETISREHARVEKKGDSCFIEDRRSRHGTSLNGEKISGATRLSQNDLIDICGIQIRFHEGAPDKKADDSDDDLDNTIIMSTVDATAEPEAIEGEDPGLKLRAVMEIIRSLHGSVQADEFLSKILESLFRIFPQAGHGMVLLVDENDRKNIMPRATRSRAKTGGASIKLSKTVVRQALDKKQAILSADALSDTMFKSSHSVSTLGIRSIMCAPFLKQNRQPMGAVQIYAEQSGRAFQQEDLDLLVSVANTTALALENLQLHADQIAKEKMLRELQLARDIQIRFLPGDNPKIPGYDFFSWYESAYSVGGDYYGFIELPGDRLAIAVGDVSGKGMPAAMLMARLSSDVRYSLIAEKDAGSAMQSVNNSLNEAEIEDKFVTLLLMVLDKNKNSLSISNAGHIPPIIKHASGEIEEVDHKSAGYPLIVSMDPNYKYKTVTVPLEAGSSVLAFTDGVIESMNSSGELFGIERVYQSLRNAPNSPSKIGDAIQEELRQFSNGDDGGAQHDDITMVCFGRGE